MTYELPLSQHDILSLGECRKARDQVVALRKCWTQRSTGGAFFTLGAAAYLDAANQQASYLAAAQEGNATLNGSFGWLLERVRRFLQNLLDETVLLDHRYAMPGFHIFVLTGRDQSRDNVAARAHFDLQWMNSMPGQRPAALLSFTLPLEEPTGGASMALWNLRYDDAVRLGLSAHRYASDHAPQTLTYARGRIVVHDGLMLHAIGSSATATPEGLRITLQGHGVRLQQGWLLYW